MSLAASVGAFLFAIERTLLRPTELRLRLPVGARRLYGLALGSCKEALQSEVYAKRRSFLSGNYFGSISEKFAREDHIPLPARLLDRDGLDLALDSTVELDLDVPDVLEIKPSILLELAAVAIGRELNEPEAIPPFETRIAGSFTTGLDPSEERLESPLQSPKRRLRAGEVSLLLLLKRLTAFGESAVVEAAVSLGRLLLGAIGIKPRLESHPRPIDVRERPAFSNTVLEAKGGEYCGHSPAG